MDVEHYQYHTWDFLFFFFCTVYVMMDGWMDEWMGGWIDMDMNTDMDMNVMLHTYVCFFVHM